MQFAKSLGCVWIQFHPRLMSRSHQMGTKYIGQLITAPEETKWTFVQKRGALLHVIQEMDPLWTAQKMEWLNLIFRARGHSCSIRTPLNSVKFSWTDSKTFGAFSALNRVFVHAFKTSVSKKREAKSPWKWLTSLIPLLKFSAKAFPSKNWTFQGETQCGLQTHFRSSNVHFSSQHVAEHFPYSQTLVFRLNK